MTLVSRDLVTGVGWMGRIYGGWANKFTVIPPRSVFQQLVTLLAGESELLRALTQQETPCIIISSYPQRIST
jgi:hypothetical protein